MSNPSTKNFLLDNLPFIKNALTIAIIVGIVVSVCNYFLNPVRNADDKIIGLKEQVIVLQQDVISIKENHLKHLEDLIL